MRALIALTLAISTACGSDGDITGVTHTVSVNGVTRTYRLVVPPTPSSGPMPLVLALHGGGGATWRFHGGQRFAASLTSRAS